MTSILGISAFYHDAAAALVVDGEIVAAAQEERFTRRKHDESLPVRAAEYCLRRAGIEAADLDYVAYYDKPLLTFDRLLETYLATAPRGFRAFTRAMPLWLREKLHVRRAISRGLGTPPRRLVFLEHHESHAASAFYPSPFEEAAILTVDGVGEWATATVGVGRGHRVEILEQLEFPHSLGLFYSAATYYLGFEVNGGEYKVMGLAPYGEPRYESLLLERVVDIRDDGSFRLDMSYFDYTHGLRMTSERFHELIGGPPRAPDAPIERRHKDLAASVQRVIERAMLALARRAHARTGLDVLCLAGGVALNGVANGRLDAEGPFERLWIQPAASDAGGSLGAALFVWHHLLDNERRPARPDGQNGSLLGPEWSDDEIEAALLGSGARFERWDDPGALDAEVARRLAEGAVVGWFQGRMEVGPRALGSRSILADPRRAETWSLLNRKIKFREGFRPFAPAVLAEATRAWFAPARAADSPYMLLVVPVAPQRMTAPPTGPAGTDFDRLREARSEIPAVTHVDGSARIQTVDAERFPRFRRLLEAFERETGCPVLVNTSFNTSDEPIVCSPDDALRTFFASDIDLLAIGSFTVDKREQPCWVDPARMTDPRAVLEPVWASPCCGARLDADSEAASCTACGREYPFDDGIARLFYEAPEPPAGDVTRSVRAFYERTPFPDYGGHESLRSLIESSRRGRYARALDRSIAYSTRVLDVGCGTGQLANFLGIGFRRVIGADASLASLRLGEAFRRRHELGRVRFVHMNLFRPAFRPESFDVVMANGVLHHTADPRRGFETLVRLVRPGGHVVVGLYGRWGRLITDLRRRIFAVTGGRMRWLDPHLRREDLSDAQRRAWFEDQYRHPHESKHTAGEVLAWFDRAGVEFVRGVPALTLDEPDLPDDEDLFRPARAGSPFEHALVALERVATGGREGGYFTMIGRRPPREES